MENGMITHKNRSPLKKILLHISSIYTLFIASWHMGLMMSVLLLWYPSWSGLTIDTVKTNFDIPAQTATNLFVVMVPIAITTAFILIIGEWKTALRWPAIIAFVGLSGASIVAKYFLFPINDIIYAGVKSEEELTQLLIKWMALNNWRVFFSALTWVAMMTFYTIKSEMRTS